MHIFLWRKEAVLLYSEIVTNNYFLRKTKKFVAFLFRMCYSNKELWGHGLTMPGVSTPEAD